MKIAFLILFVIMEVPFFIKFIQAHKNIEIIRQTAILVIMLIIAVVFFAVYKIFM